MTSDETAYPSRRCGLLGCAALVGILAAGCASSADVVAPLTETVSMASGTIEGVRLASGVLTFKGVPYAAPPVGNLRWRAPRPASTWDTPRPATDLSPACWQPLAAAGSFYGGGDIERSEDCLYLNVWTAAERADETRPVMVWIHGGGLQTGSGGSPLYDGETFASRGVVLVTINYRLGPMGFLAHPELSAENASNPLWTPDGSAVNFESNRDGGHGPPSSGNYGILDQIAALRWVNDNIHHFGGDAERITVFGESAGSWSVNYLTASPLAAGLFQRAIGQSGGIFSPMPQLTGEGSSESAGESFAETLDATDVAALRAKTPQEIYDAQAAGALQLGPTTDGWVFPRDVYDIFASGDQNDVDTIVGFNADEGTALFAPAVPDTVAGYEQWLGETYGDHAADFRAVYPAETDAQSKVAGYENMADSYFAWQMRSWARLQANTGTKPVRMYFFSRVPPWDEGDTYGVYHAAEIIYAFDNLDKSGSARTEIGPFNHAWEDVDHDLARTMSSYWINFATSGDPNGDGLPSWPMYDPARDPVLELGDEITVVEGLWKERLDAFDAYYEAQRAGG